MCLLSWDRSVAIVTNIQAEYLGHHGSASSRAKSCFFFFRQSRLAPIQGALKALFLGVNQPGHEVDTDPISCPNAVRGITVPFM